MSHATRADAAVPDRDLLAALVPRFHVTAQANWLNDPNALTYRNGRYHLFYQYNPDSPHWGPPQWGHVSSADLLRWRRHDVALRPGDGGPDRDGCWSGCLRVIDGQPRIYYTGIIENGSSRIESVCLARGSSDLDRWQRDPASPLIARPPAALGSGYHRDPFLWHDARGWHMLLGSGRPAPDERGRIAVYHSDDALSWTYGGLFADGPRQADGIDLGVHWECPQLLTLGETAVLLISAQDPDAAHPMMHTAYALGTIDNYRFRPQTWGLLDHGDSFYAATTGLDADGTPLLFGWAQENMPPATQSLMPKVGALSLPRTLRIDGAQLGTGPARQLSGLRTTKLSPNGHPSPLGAQFKVSTATGGGGTSAAISLRSADGGTLTAAVTAVALTLHIGEPGSRAPRRLHAPFTRTPARGTAVELYGDGSLIEVFCAGRAVTTRWYRDPRRTELTCPDQTRTGAGGYEARTVDDQAVEH